MKAIKRVITVVISTLLVLLISFNVYNFICVSILHKDLASIGGYSVLEVVSGSMEPTIHVGDLIIIDTNTKNYSENDIVTFYDVKGSFVTHRIISIDKDEMITKGDNNNTEDEAIATKNIIGKYVFKLTGMGHILASFRSPLVLILILVIGILVCVVMSLDKDGKPIIDEEDKELEEFRKYKKQKKLEESTTQIINSKVSKSKETTKIANKNDSNKAKTTVKKAPVKKKNKVQENKNSNTKKDTVKTTSTKKKTEANKATKTTKKQTSSIKNTKQSKK